MKFTQDEISEIKELIEEESSLWGESESILEENGYTVKRVYENDWGEGALENVEIVLDIRKDEKQVFIQMEGFYDSWNGTEFQGTKVVEPYTFTETRYK